MMCVRHSACGDFLGSASDASLRRMSNTPHSLTSHNPKNSLTILECQVLLWFYKLAQNPRIAGHSACGTILECQDSLGLQNLRIANSLSCHSEAIAEESKGAISNEMFRSTQHDKVSDSGTDSQISESTPLLQDSKASAAIHKAKEQSSITNLALVSKIITNTTI